MIAVHCGVCRIFKLLRYPYVFIVFLHIERSSETFVDALADISVVVHEHELRTVRFHELSALLAYRVGHYDAHLVALYRTDECESDTLVAARRLDYDGVFVDYIVFLSLEYHIVGSSRFDRAAYVESLVLYEYLGRVLGHYL